MWSVLNSMNYFNTLSPRCVGGSHDPRRQGQAFREETLPMIGFARSTLLCVCAAAGGLAFAASAAAQSVATLGDVKLTAEDVAQLAKGQPQLKPQILASDTALQDMVKQELIRRELLEEAGARGWDKRPDITRAVEVLREQVVLRTYLDSVSEVPKDYPGEAAVKAYYDANQGKLTLPLRFHLAQVFVARPAGVDEAAAAERRAADIAARAQKPGADFAALARAESADAASRDKGGDIGWLVERSILPEIRAVLPQLQPGAVSNPVASANGWHIVRLIEFKPKALATFDEARPAVIRQLRAERAVQLQRAYVDALLKKTPPQIDTAALGALRNKLK
jgi:peptidylprolyl isomerase